MRGASYPLPSHSASHESARLNVQHELSLLDLDGALLLSSFPPQPEISTDVHAPPFRDADIGSGTGVWAAEFARQNPSTHVVGLDLGLPSLSSDAPSPANLHFAIADIETPWPTDGPAAGPFDLVHGRQVLLNLRNPSAALRRAWDNMKPGAIIEFREFWNPMVSELAELEGAKHKVPLLVEWHCGTVAAAAALGCDHGFAAKLPSALKDAGFVDVRVVDRVVPLGGWVPSGGNQDERTQRMDDLLREMIRVGAPGMTSEMFVRGLGWSEESATKYAGRVLQELERRDLGSDRIYARFRIACAMKPME